MSERSSPKVPARPRWGRVSTEVTDCHITDLNRILRVCFADSVRIGSSRLIASARVRAQLFPPPTPLNLRKRIFLFRAPREVSFNSPGFILLPPERFCPTDLKPTVESPSLNSYCLTDSEDRIIVVHSSQSFDRGRSFVRLINFCLFSPFPSSKRPSHPRWEAWSRMM
jgi:hypothetical protein